MAFSKPSTCQDHHISTNGSHASESTVPFCSCFDILSKRRIPWERPAKASHLPHRTLTRKLFAFRLDISQMMWAARVLSNSYWSVVAFRRGYPSNKKRDRRQSRRNSSDVTRSCDHAADRRNQWNPSTQLAPATFVVTDQLSQVYSVESSCLRQISRCRLLVGELCFAQSQRCGSFHNCLKQGSKQVAFEIATAPLWFTRQIITGPTGTLVRLLEIVPTPEPKLLTGTCVCLRTTTSWAVRCWKVAVAARQSATCMFAARVAPMPRVSVEKFTFVPVRAMSKRFVASREDEAIFAQDFYELIHLQLGKALVWDELEAELILVQHILGLPNSKPDILGRLARSVSS